MLQKTLDLVREHTGSDLPHYTDCVVAAFEKVDPLFMRDKYLEFFWHCATTVPGWLAQVILGNAQTESDGSAKLLDLWQAVNFNREVEDKVLFHATDEARHSRLFVKLADMIFPGMFVGDFLHRMRTSLTKIDRNRLVKSDSPIDEALLIDHLVQMNMGEIRTRLHMEMLAPVMNAFAPEEARPELQETLNGLAHDEIVHIGYIADILEKWSENGDKERIKRMYTARLIDFHQFTFAQTEPAVRSFGQGRFPELLEI